MIDADVASTFQLKLEMNGFEVYSYISLDLLCLTKCFAHNAYVFLEISSPELRDFPVVDIHTAVHNFLYRLRVPSSFTC